MQIIKVVTTVVATACLSTAVPTAHEKEVQQEAPAIANGNAFCGNGQVMSCCNKKEGNKGFDLLSGVLGGDCSPLNLDLLKGTLANVGLSPSAANEACGTQEVACCTGDQYGLVNVQCGGLVKLLGGHH